MDDNRLVLSGSIEAVAVATSLVDKAFHYMGGDKDDRKQELLQDLGSIQAYLHDIQRRVMERHEQLAMGFWLSCLKYSTLRFREAVGMLVDAVDKTDYQSVKPEVRNPNSKFVKKKIVNIISRVVDSKRNQELRARKLVLYAVVELQQNASQLLEDCIYFYSTHAVDSTPSSTLDMERYPSWVASGEVFGRHREKEQIVQWLTEDTAEEIPISIFTVVGMAGMGKTTLVNVVREDPRVWTNFNAVVWVPVSANFDTEEMARVALESITTGKPPAYSSLQNSLTDTLRYRKVLLILDDVWEDTNIEKWETFLAPLRVCKKGSRILLTTRLQSVVQTAAFAIGTAVEYLKLGDLDEDENLMLFKSRLPPQAGSVDFDNLLLIGEQIMKKIGGCPLVTNLVASWLGSHMETHHWINVLQKGWQHIEHKDIILASFRLSYDYLPPELKACFRYCSLFPRGYKFNKSDLLQMWTGSALPLIPFDPLKQENIDLQETKNIDIPSAEDFAERYFDALVRKSFFCCMLETEPSSGDLKEYHVLPTLMHDLAQLVSRGECARVDNGDFHDVSYATQHLSIANSSDLRVISGNSHLISGFRFLHTLIITNEFSLDQETELVLGTILECSRNLRLLYLDVPSLFHALDRISGLTHLRYLFLFSCGESHLHKVFKLHHLQVFKLKYFTSKEADCRDIHNLCFLRCLHVPDNMSSYIHQIGRLTTLQELHGFEVVENNGQRLSELGNLNSLCQLSLRNLQNVLNGKEAMEIKLKDKKQMQFFPCRGIST